MALEKLVNSGQTTITGSINNTSNPVTFSVASASIFPTSGNFRVKIDDEILLVTSISGTSLTATRAQEGTTIASHASSSVIAHILTAESLKLFIRQNAWCPYPRFTVGASDDEFDDENFSGWTLVEPGSPTVTITEVNDQLSIRHPGTDTAWNLHAIMKSMTINVGDSIEFAWRMDGALQNYNQVGLLMADGSTFGAGNQIAFLVSPAEKFWILKDYTNYVGSGAGNIVDRNPQHPISHVFMRLKRSATNTYQAYVSPNGVDWAKVCSDQSTGAWTPTWGGFYCTPIGGTLPFVVSVEYFRKV